jgi:hypothetical protein
MRRISTIRDKREVAAEVRRENLRDRRWARQRSKVLTAAVALSMILAAGKVDLTMLWPWR